MDIPPIYLDQIRERFPGVDLSTMRLNCDGLVNDIVIVNDEWVFRFPKNEAGKQVMAREAGILDLVRRHVDMPVPALEQITDDYAMVRFIPGLPLDRNTILGQDERTQDQLAEQLAVFLRQLHAIPNDALAQHFFSKPDSTREDWAARLSDIERDIYPFLWADQKHWVAELFAPALDGRLDMCAYDPVLIHDDLASYHILFDPAAKRINGVIDFGAARLGDPASDFALLINVLGESFLRRMQAFYPAIEAALDRARFLAGALELWWVAEGLRTNDLSWFMVHIGRARDVLPIGWRYDLGTAFNEARHNTLDRHFGL
jgi:aminoglycoside 2''-phosphotransferase